MRSDPLPVTPAPGPSPVKAAACPRGERPAKGRRQGADRQFYQL